MFFYGKQKNKLFFLFLILFLYLTAFTVFL